MTFGVDMITNCSQKKHQQGKKNLETALNKDIDKKIKLLRNWWECSKSGCSSSVDHCFIHPESCEHFLLSHNHFSVWATAQVTYILSIMSVYSWVLTEVSRNVAHNMLTQRNHQITRNSSISILVSLVNTRLSSSGVLLSGTNLRLLQVHPSSTSISHRKFSVSFVPQLLLQQQTLLLQRRPSSQPQALIMISYSPCQQSLVLKSHMHPAQYVNGVRTSMQ